MRVSQRLLPMNAISSLSSLRATYGLQLRYSVNEARSATLGAPFIELDADLATQAYLARTQRERHGRWLTWLHRSLRWFLSDFDINGLLGTYPMHVLSTGQWRAILPHVHGGRLLDVGAGRGDVTSQLAALFDEVTVTETSKPMAKRLARRGYRVHVGDLAQMPQLSERYDVVSLLNVLDRCDRPLSLLAAARAALRPGGRLVLALVLPYRPFVYDAGRARAPLERLPIERDEFELAAVELVHRALLPLGLTVESFSRTPYLSGGDAERTVYELDDLIVVARADFELPIL